MMKVPTEKMIKKHLYILLFILFLNHPSTFAKKSTFYNAGNSTCQLLRSQTPRPDKGATKNNLRKVELLTVVKRKKVVLSHTHRIHVTGIFAIEGGGWYKKTYVYKPFAHHGPSDSYQYQYYLSSKPPITYKILADS